MAIRMDTPKSYVASVPFATVSLKPTSGQPSAPNPYLPDGTVRVLEEDGQDLRVGDGKATPSDFMAKLISILLKIDH